MTVGERIKFYRTRQAMSQETLGQKLFVTRQTVSLWETDQTLPTIDNLIRLKEIFHVSLDALLDGEAAEDTAVKHYHLAFTAAECVQLRRAYLSPALRQLFVSMGLELAAVLLSLFSSTPPAVTGFCVGVFLTGSILSFRRLRTVQNTWNRANIAACQYDYRVYEDRFAVQITNETAKLQSGIIPFTQIRHVDRLGRYFVVTAFGQSYLCPPEVLESAFGQVQMLPGTQRKPLTGWKRFASVSLLVASLLSIFASLMLVAYVSERTVQLPNNMWRFYLLTPIPIASTVCGFYWKAKGYSGYKKNILTGLLMTGLLFVYGSFWIIF